MVQSNTTTEHFAMKVKSRKSLWIKLKFNIKHIPIFSRVKTVSYSIKDLNQKCQRDQLDPQKLKDKNRFEREN